MKSLVQSKAQNTVTQQLLSLKPGESMLITTPRGYVAVIGRIGFIKREHGIKFSTENQGENVLVIRK